jgi:alpha-1,2-mannosyltransferase
MLTFAVCALVYVPTASLRYEVSIDVQAAVLPAIQIARTGTPWLNGLDLLGNPWLSEIGEHAVSNRPIGISLLAVPFYLVAGSPFLLWPSAVAAAVCTAGAVAMAHMALRRLVPPATAASVTFVFAFATPTWTVSADGLWGHTATQLSIAAALLAASRGRLWLVGVALGLGILARPHVAVVALVVGLGMSLTQRSWRPALAVGLPTLLGMLSLVGANQWIYSGRVLISAYGDYVSENLTRTPSIWDGLVNLLGFLVAPNRGVLVWTPLLLLLLPAAWRARRDAPSWVITFALAGLAYSLVQLRINAFHGGDSFFGYRHGLELLTCIVPLYALAWSRVTSPTVKGVAAGMVVLQTTAMAYGALVPTGYGSGDDAWRRNNFVDVFLTSAVGLLGLVLLAWLCVRVGLDVRSRAAVQERRAPPPPPPP